MSSAPADSRAAAGSPSGSPGRQPPTPPACRPSCRWGPASSCCSSAWRSAPSRRGHEGPWRSWGSAPPCWACACSSGPAPPRPSPPRRCGAMDRRRRVRGVPTRRRAGRAAAPHDGFRRGRRRRDAARVSSGRRRRRRRRRRTAAATAGRRPVWRLSPPIGRCGEPRRACADDPPGRRRRPPDPPRRRGDALQLALPEPEAGLAAGILVGLRERVDRSLAADFATAGVSHVVAISGWNIAIVAGLVGALMRGRPRRLVTLASSARSCAYVVAAGASPSVVRAAVMAGVVLLARESGRAGRAPAALGAGGGDAAARGAHDDRRRRVPALGHSRPPGCSRGRTRSARWLGGLAGGRLPGWLAESLGISLAAQAATLPDVLATFGRLSLVSPAVNLAVVPLVPAAMAGGVLAIAGGASRRLGRRRRSWRRWSGCRAGSSSTS